MTLRVLGSFIYLARLGCSDALVACVHGMLKWPPAPMMMMLADPETILPATVSPRSSSWTAPTGFHMISFLPCKWNKKSIKFLSKVFANVGRIRGCWPQAPSQPAPWSNFIESGCRMCVCLAACGPVTSVAHTPQPAVILSSVICVTRQANHCQYQRNIYLSICLSVCLTITNENGVCNRFFGFYCSCVAHTFLRHAFCVTSASRIIAAAQQRLRRVKPKYIIITIMARVAFEGGDGPRACELWATIHSCSGG